MITYRTSKVVVILSDQSRIGNTLVEFGSYNWLNMVQTGKLVLVWLSKVQTDKLHVGLVWSSAGR